MDYEENKCPVLESECDEQRCFDGTSKHVPSYIIDRNTENNAMSEFAHGIFNLFE